MSEDSANKSMNSSEMYFGWGITPPSPFPYRYFVVSGKPTDAGKQAAVQAARRAAEDEAVFRAGLKESYK